MGREAWVQAVKGNNFERWEKARNLAIYQAVKQGGRGTRERIAEAHNISRQRVAEIVELTELRILNGDYEGAEVLKSDYQLRAEASKQKPKDPD